MEVDEIDESNNLVSFGKQHYPGSLNVSVKENIKEHNPNLFPNPFNESLSINNTGDIQSIKFYNILGTLVGEKNITHTSALDMSSFANGVYIAVFMDANNNSIGNKKIIKANSLD